MKRFSEADLLAFEHARAHAGWCPSRHCNCRYLQSVIEILTAYIRATVGVEPIAPWPRTREYDGWEERWAAYGETLRAAGGGR